MFFDATSFNPNIDSCNVDKIINIEYTFSHAISFKPDLGNVTDTDFILPLLNDKIRINLRQPN